MSRRATNLVPQNLPTANPAVVGLRFAVPAVTMRVLIVDDYPGLIELYDLALRARGFEVGGAATAGEAMTLAATQQSDAVVLCGELPDGSGPELVTRMRRITSLSAAHSEGMSSE